MLSAPILAAFTFYISINPAQQFYEMGGLTPFYWWGNQGSKGEDSYPSANCQGRIQGLCDSKAPAFQ